MGRGWGVGGGEARRGMQAYALGRQGNRGLVDVGGTSH
jgi:hypothetical protein